MSNGWLTETDILFQKSICYSHHKENYLRGLLEGIQPVGLRLKKTAFGRDSGGLSNDMGWSPLFGRNEFGATFECGIR